MINSQPVSHHVTTLSGQVHNTAAIVTLSSSFNLIATNLPLSLSRGNPTTFVTGCLTRRPAMLVLDKFCLCGIAAGQDSDEVLLQVLALPYLKVAVTIAAPCENDSASMGEGGGQPERYGAGATERASGIPSKSRLVFSVSDRRHELVT
jgi:hypothetical protein